MHHAPLQHQVAADSIKRLPMQLDEQLQQARRVTDGWGVLLRRSQPEPVCKTLSICSELILLVLLRYAGINVDELQWVLQRGPFAPRVS